MAEAKTAIVTGAAGFVGYHLTKTLSDFGYQVYALIRPGSNNNDRIAGIPNVASIEVDVGNANSLSSYAPRRCNYFFHLAWNTADRMDYMSQMDNAYATIRTLELASEIECRRFVGIGSQAEYGATSKIMREDETPIHPFCGYGAAKVAACRLTMKRARELGMEWVWGRIFSVYGKYEPATRILPHIMGSIMRGNDVSLSSCRQNWDFLYGDDAGKALVALAEKGKNGEIYNIADGRYRSLKDYVERVVALCGGKGKVHYGDDLNPFVSLQPSVEKLSRDTGWAPTVGFDNGVQTMLRNYNRA